MAHDYSRDTALIVVDMQNDFADPEGNLYVQGGDDIVDVVNDEIAAARAAGAIVVYTQDWHPPETPHFADQGGIWPRHCVRDTTGAEFHPDLRVEGPVVRKGTDGGDGYSGFSIRDPTTGEEDETELDDTLRAHGTDRVVVVGLAQDVCVHETAKDAVAKGYDTALVLAATRPVDPAAADQLLEELRALGVRLA